MEIQKAEKSHLKLVRSLRKAVWQAQDEYQLINDGDTILVCLSGGKDSYTMLDMLMNIRRTDRMKFDLIAVHLDQKQPGYPKEVMANYLESYGLPFKILEKDTYRIVQEKLTNGQTMCSLCSRLRRGTIYEYARTIGANKIALGHHREDVLETFLLNLFFSGKLESMPPTYLTDDEQLTVIRPLVFCPEDRIAEYAALREFPIIPCNLCGSQPNMQRSQVKQMLQNWEVQFPDRKEIMMTALKNIHASHLFDSDAFNFKELFNPIGLAIE